MSGSSSTGEGDKQGLYNYLTLIAIVENNLTSIAIDII